MNRSFAVEVSTAVVGRHRPLYCPGAVKLTETFARFAKSEQFGGVLLLGCTVVSLALANSPLSAAYIDVWHLKLGPAEPRALDQRRADGGVFPVHRPRARARAVRRRAVEIAQCAAAGIRGRRRHGRAGAAALRAERRIRRRRRASASRWRPTSRSRSACWRCSATACRRRSRCSSWRSRSSTISAPSC